MPEDKKTIDLVDKRPIEIPDEELENVTGGASCFLSSTYGDLGIVVESPQLFWYHPLVVLAYSSCNLHPRYGNVQETCITCLHHYSAGPSIVCKIRSMESDPKNKH